MATIDIHDLETYDDGDFRHLKGISTLGFSSTEARLNIGFRVHWSAAAYVDRITVSTLTRPHGLHEDRVVSVINSQLSSHTSAQDVRADGCASVELPFELAVNIARWRTDGERFIPPELVPALQEVLCLAIEANATPEFGGGRCQFLEPEFPEESE